MIKRQIASVQKGCVACGNCVKYCPRNAILVYKGIYAVVDKEKCIGCRKCMINCPAGIICMIDKEDV